MVKLVYLEDNYSVLLHVYLTVFSAIRCPVNPHPHWVIGIWGQTSLVKPYHYHSSAVWPKTGYLRSARPGGQKADCLRQAEPTKYNHLRCEQVPYRNISQRITILPLTNKNNSGVIGRTYLALTFSLIFSTCVQQYLSYMVSSRECTSSDIGLWGSVGQNKEWS